MIDSGPWKITEGKGVYPGIEEGIDYYIDSEDFHHDVRLIINGDFINSEEKLKYAKELAQRLNVSTI